MVEISKLAFKPEGQLKDVELSSLMGLNGMRLVGYKRELVKVWFKDLKEITGNYCREFVRTEVIENATTFAYGWVCIQDIQNAWALALDHQTRLLVGKKIMKCFTEGYFKDRAGLKSNISWKYALEQEMFEKYNLAYLVGEDAKEVGCLAKQASRSRADVLKQLERKGKKVHGFIVSRKSAKNNQRKRKKKSQSSDNEECEFLSSFVREAETHHHHKEQVKKKTKAKKIGGGTILDPMKKVM